MSVEPLQGEPMTRGWLQEQSEGRLRSLANQTNAAGTTNIDSPQTMSKSELVSALDGVTMPGKAGE